MGRGKQRPYRPSRQIAMVPAAAAMAQRKSVATMTSMAPPGGPCAPPVEHLSIPVPTVSLSARPAADLSA